MELWWAPAQIYLESGLTSDQKNFSSTEMEKLLIAGLLPPNLSPWPQPSSRNWRRRSQNRSFDHSRSCAVVLKLDCIGHFSFVYTTSPETAAPSHRSHFRKTNNSRDMYFVPCSLLCTYRCSNHVVTVCWEYAVVGHELSAKLSNMAIAYQV